jgi:hypothetical protein
MAGKNLYKNQTNARLRFPSGIDLTGATTMRIYYKKPDKTASYWSATALGQDLIYKPTTGQLDQIGAWTFRNYVVIAGEEGWGDPTTIEVRPNS